MRFPKTHYCHCVCTSTCAFSQKHTISATFPKLTISAAFSKVHCQACIFQSIRLVRCFSEFFYILTSIRVSQHHSPRLYVTLGPSLKVCVSQNSRQLLIPISKNKENITTMFFTSTTTILSLFRPYPCCIQLEILCKLSKHSSKCKKCAEGWRNCCLQIFSVRFWQLLKEKLSFQQESQ